MTLDALNGLVPIAFPVQVSPDLPVTQCLERRTVRGITPPQAAHLIQQTPLQHALDPGLDAFVEPGTFHVQADTDKPVGLKKCTGLFEQDIDITFETYEQLPDGEFDGEPRVRLENGQLQLDIGAIIWEEFALTLPFKPLCSEECKGICPGCGKDLNTEACECKQDEGDERLAVFRDLKIK